MKTARCLVVGALLLVTSCSRTFSKAAERVEPLPKIIWLSHHDLVVADWERILLSTNGTQVFVSSKPGIAFPERELVPIYVPTLPPELKITGMRVCYSIIGNHPDTKVHRLSLAQFEGTSAGYVVRMEDTTAGSGAPPPPPGGFAWDDPNGFLCVDSSVKGVCLDPATGTISADTGVQLGDQDDRLAIMAIGLSYDTACTPP